MTRTSTFAIVTLAAIAATSLSTAASAHFAGGGGSFAGGFSGGGHSGFGGPISATGGFAHPPVAASGIGRSVISRMPTGSSIARSSITARKPALSGTGTGGAADAGGHSNIVTTPVISQLPKAPTPPNPIQDPNHNKPGTGPNFGPGVVPVVPVVVPVDVPVGAPVVVAGSEVSASAVGVDAQPAAAARAAQPTCTCLTKRYLDDGSVLFQDTCSKEAALATPAQLKLQALKLNR